MSFLSSYFCNCFNRAWSPENGPKVLTDMGLLEDIQTGYVFPEEYRIVFESLHRTKEFKQSWIYNETLNTETTTIV